MEQSLQVMSKQERLENWTTRIMACRSSGMTVRAWGRENGLSDITFFPALCKDCKKQLPSGYDSRYVFADLYGMEEKILIPIEADTAFSLRCYDVTTQTDTEKSGISVVIRGMLKD